MKESNDEMDSERELQEEWTENELLWRKSGGDIDSLFGCIAPEGEGEGEEECGVFALDSKIAIEGSLVVGVVPADDGCVVEYEYLSKSLDNAEVVAEFPATATPVPITLVGTGVARGPWAEVGLSSVSV